MNNRIKELRKTLHLTQEKFASKIGLSRNFIAQIEIGTAQPSNRTILDICKAYNVNENWLRSGIGDMFINIPKEDEYIKAAMELSNQKDELAMQIVIEYWKLDESSKKVLKNFVQNIYEKTKK